ncbi:PucR family transcriptional regulator [Burkholderia sp. Bp8963]|nr:PucR family transcriptional regulator [Burkholderia sp. Bp8963]
MHTGHVNVPEISAAMRAKLRELALDPSEVIEHTYAALTRIEGYEGLSSAVRKDIMDSIALSKRLWFESLFAGTFPSSDDLEAFQEFGRRRVHQGIPLPSLLRAFRVGLREVWRKCAELGNEDDALRDELLFVISPYLMDYFDDMAQLISRAYLDEQHQQARWRESLRYQLHEIIFSHAGDDDAFRKITNALGLDHSVRRIAIAIESERLDRSALHSEEEADRVMLAVARHLKTARDSLIDVWHRDRLVVWAPCIHDESASASDRRVAERMSALLDGLPSVASVGIGLASAGAKGWAASAEEALRALDFGRSLNAGRRMHRYSDIVLEECIRSHDSALNYLLSLIEEVSSEPEIVLTLEAFFANMQRRKVTAAALGIHPNTLDHRLDRVENITGAKLDDAAWIARFEIALKLRRMHA